MTKLLHIVMCVVCYTSGVKMKKILRSIHANRISSERGQSLVEIAIFLPIFILLIAGIAEMGWYINRYLNMLDASREAARLAADKDPFGNGTSVGNPVYNPQYNANSPSYNPAAPIDCDTTTDTYAVIACYTEESLIGVGVPFSRTNGYDDIIISAFTIKGGRVHNGWRYPDYFEGTSELGLGWSYTGNQPKSLFPNSRIDLLIEPDATSPDQGLIILEIFYRHRQVLALPFFTIFVPADIGIHVYTIMPNPTAGTVQ